MRVFTGFGIHFQSHIFPWDQVTGVTVDGGEVAKSKIAAVLVFGVFGLAAKDKKDRAFLSVHRHDGATACFQFEKLSPQALTAKLSRVLLKVGVPFLDDPESRETALETQSPQQPSVADELAKLAQLRDRGILTDDEFAAQKARLLGGT